MFLLVWDQFVSVIIFLFFFGLDGCNLIKQQSTTVAFIRNKHYYAKSLCAWKVINFNLKWFSNSIDFVCVCSSYCNDFFIHINNKFKSKFSWLIVSSTAIEYLINQIDDCDFGKQLLHTKTYFSLQYLYVVSYNYQQIF